MNVANTVTVAIDLVPQTWNHKVKLRQPKHCIIECPPYTTIAYAIIYGSSLELLAFSADNCANFCGKVKKNMYDFVKSCINYQRSQNSVQFHGNRNSAAKGKLRGLARNSVICGKLEALLLALVFHTLSWLCAYVSCD